MTRPAAPVDGRASQPALRRRASRGAGERLLDELLEIVCRVAKLASAAVYSVGDRGLELEATVGDETFPPALAEGEVHPFTAVELPRGALLLPPAGDLPELAELPATALAAALRSVDLERRLKRQRFEVNYRVVELESLYDIGLAIASTRDLERLGREILMRAVSLLDARRGALYLAADGAYRLDGSFGGDADPSLVGDDPQVDRLLAGEAPTEPAVLPGAEHLMAVAIEAESRRLGLLVVADKESRRGVGPFPPSDRRTLGLFANQAAIALENADLQRQAIEKERLERELDLAAEIQRRLLPAELPRVPGVETAGWSRPARHVGGDYYNLTSLPGGRVGAVLADVSGKGMPAALMVSTIESGLRLLSGDAGLGADLVSRLNRHIVESSAPNKFITCLVADFDPAAGRLGWVNAGHNPGLVVRHGGEAVELEASGFPLGMFAGGSYQDGSVELGPGDLFCVYSDGITECADPAGEEFGPERLIELLRARIDHPLPEIVAAVDEAVTRFECGASQGDDQTLVLLRPGG